MNFWTRFAAVVWRLIPFFLLLPPAAADRRQLLRPGLQPASGGHQHHRGNPALHRQRRRHDLGGGVRLPQQHGGFRGDAQRQTEEGKRFHPGLFGFFSPFYSPFVFPLLRFSQGRSCSQWRRLVSKFTQVPPRTEIKCSGVHFSLTGSPSSSSLKPAHLTSNLKAVRGQSGADCHGGHVRHKTLLLCFQCDIPPPIPLKGIAFNQSSGGDWGKLLRIHQHPRERSRRRRPDASVAVEFPRAA